MKRGQTNQTKDGPGFLILDKQENSQVGLVPSNYLQELSQFLTQDVNSGRNGSEGPVRTSSLLCLQAGSLHWFLFPGNKRTSDKREWSSERGDTGQVLVLRTHQPRRVRRHNGPEGSRWRFPGKLELPVRHKIEIGKKSFSSQFFLLLGERLRINNRGLLCFFESTRQKQAL